MLSRLAGRLITGRFGFLVAGTADFVAFGLVLARARLASRLRRR